MRIVSVILTKAIEGTILNANSFGIFEEQLSNDVLEKAEDLFIEKCVETKFGSETNTTRKDLEERDFYRDDIVEKLIDGYVKINDTVVSIVFTEI